MGGFKKERVALTLNGEKIGHAEVSNSGLLTATVNSDAVAKLPLGNIQSLSISVNIKE
jgi:hypothetical protein